MFFTYCKKFHNKRKFFISDKVLVFSVLYLIIFLYIFFYNQSIYNWIFHAFFVIISIFFLRLKIFLAILFCLIFFLISFLITKSINFFNNKNYLSIISETKNSFVCKKDFQNYFFLKKTSFNQNKLFIGMKIVPLKISYFHHKSQFFKYNYKNYLFSNYIKGNVIIYEPNYSENKNNFLLNFKNYGKNLKSLFLRSLIFYNFSSKNHLLKAAKDYNFLQYLIISSLYLTWLKKIYFFPLKRFLPLKLIEIVFLLFLLIYCYLLTFALVIFRLFIKEIIVFFLKFKYHYSNLLVWSLSTLFFLLFFPKMIGTIAFFYCFMVGFFAIIFLELINNKIKNNITKKILLTTFIFIICSIFSLYLNKKANILAIFFILIVETISIFFFLISFPFAFLQIDITNLLFEKIDFLYQKTFFFIINFSYFLKI
ncbi:hypothetical protein JTY60_02385 [symbiont of Argiope bruennichi]|uniref:hypothetical protein n=1 Tax=symbiont of Argiope bruennichi TaxID=2810479 RepID=UPI003DA5C994